MKIDQETQQEDFLVRVVPEVEGLRDASILSLAAVPGEGLGRYVDCSRGRAILTINEQRPRGSGSFLFSPVGNCSIERELETIGDIEQVKEWLLKIRQMGSPCCTCDNYVYMYNKLSKEYNLAKKVAAKIKATRDIYYGLKDKLIDEKALRERGLNLYLELQSRPGFFLSVMLQLKNDSAFTTSTPLTISLNFSGGGTFVEAVRGSGLLTSNLDGQAGKHTQTQPGGAYPNLSVYTGALLPGTRWIRYTFQLLYKSTGTVSCTASTSVAGTTVTARDNAALQKPLNLEA